MSVPRVCFQNPLRGNTVVTEILDRSVEPFTPSSMDLVPRPHTAKEVEEKYRPGRRSSIHPKRDTFLSKARAWKNQQLIENQWIKRDPPKIMKSQPNLTEELRWICNKQRGRSKIKSKPDKSLRKSLGALLLRPFL